VSGADAARGLIDEGRRLRGAGDRVRSLATFRRATEADPTNVTAIVECGYDHLHLVQVVEARAAFERGLALDADNKSALIGLGHTFRHLKLLDEAERAFRRVLELEPGHGGGSMGLAYTLRSLDRRDEALEAFQAAAKAGHAGARAEAANLLRDLGRSTEAVALLRELVSREPSNTAHLATLARLLNQTGAQIEAIVVFRQLIAQEPANLTARIELGHLLRETNALDEAEDVLSAVLRAAPDNASALNALGWVFRRAKRLDKAADCFERLATLQPANVGALHALGLIARERGDHEASLAFFTRGRAVDPTAQHVRLEIGHSLQHLKRLNAAIAEFEGMLRDWPGERKALLGLAYALRESGRVEAALAAFDDADRADPAQPNAAIEAGHVLLRLGRPSEAEGRFRSALDRAPGNPAALVGLSYALRRVGRLDEAETCLREVLAKQPDHSGATVALGHLLDAQYRLDEAAELFGDVIARESSHADAHAALGNIHRRRNDREAALASFRRAADADLPNTTRLIDVAVELRDLGRFDESRAMLDDVLAALPAEPRALMQRGQLLRRQDRREDALAVFTDILTHHPDHAQAMAEAATEERALGRPQLARKRLEEALAAETDHVGALLGIAELEMQADDPDAALGLYRRAATAHPTNVWAHLGGARAAFEAGARDEAFRIITEARDRLGPHPEMAGMEVELLRHLREWTAAREILDRASAETARPNFWLWSHKVQIATMTADYTAATKMLAAAPAASATDAARVALLRGQLAEAQFRYDDAIGDYQESIRLNPGDAWAHFELSRAALMNLDIDTARGALAGFIRLSRSSLLLKGQSLSPSQNHVGQLLDEFVLDAGALTVLKTIRTTPLDRQLAPLQQLIQKYPDYTPAAMILAIVLRQSGEFARPRQADTAVHSAIPRHIVQFWDRDPPEDVRELMASWQKLNPAHRWTGFDDDAARAFIAGEFGAGILAAYARSAVPAQKADLFRLAFLAARGGSYADADDRCLAPLDGWIDPAATLVVHQENYGSIGNNFVAVTPEHPVIMRALELGAAAINRGDTDLIWLSTGPGLLTRAFAQVWAEGQPGGLLRRTQVLDLGELQRVIGIHCPVRYKTTERHWSRAAFRRERPKAARGRGRADNGPA
jgi:tetratricopeptide (TPR) repeat protein